MFFALLTLNKKNPLAHAPRHEFLAEHMGISWDYGQGYPLVIQHSYGKSQFFMGKFTISMVIFNSYVKLPEGRLLSVQVEDLMGFHWIEKIGIYNPWGYDGM